MKKTIIAIAAAAMLTIGNGFAQKQHFPVDRGYSHQQRDDAREEYELKKLDRIVNLTRKQQNAVKKIEDRYDRLSAGNRRSASMHQIRRWEIQKQQEILTVLTPKQHQRLLAYERTQHSFQKNNWKRRG
jgi:Spy/CpxP family protein refolding chaperone